MIETARLKLSTRGNGDMIDITDALAQVLSDGPLAQGLLTVFCPSATSAVTTIEYEGGALHDLRRLFDEIAPPEANYQHNLRWGDGNGHSHVRAALLGPSLSVPFMERRLLLGTWQQVVYVDFDIRPRERSLIVQMVGEA